MVLAIIGDFFHTNAIIGYNFNYLPLRIIGYFLLMGSLDWFFLVFTTYNGFHYMNYLKFTYFDLIPKKKSSHTSIREYRKVVSKLRRPYHFYSKALGIPIALLTLFTLIYCLPVTFYVLFLGNYPPVNSIPAEDIFVMQYTPYIILFLNIFFILAGLFLWFKLPQTIQTIPEELYSIPPEYVDILLRLEPQNQAIIEEFQNRTKKLPAIENFKQNQHR